MIRLIFLVIIITPVIVSSSNGCDASNERIINGQDQAYVPYVAKVSAYSLVMRKDGGGSFITHRHVLTAASVIYNMTYWYVGYGRNILVNIPTEETSEALMHPEYDPISSANDIGILFLRTRVNTTWVSVIPLPSIQNTPLVNEQGKVSGFGMMQSGSNWTMNNNKQSGFFRKIPDIDCLNLLGERFEEAKADTHFCAMDLDNGASICHGDYGNGLTIYIEQVNTLVGLASVFTNMCYREYPSMFTQVSLYTDWITENIPELQGD